MNRKVRSGKKTIVFEVKVALDSIDYIGQSKRVFRSQGIKGIHSCKQKKNTFSDGQNFVKWVRQQEDTRLKLKEVTNAFFCI